MKWQSKLSKLILSFYREDPAQLRQISCLSNCQVSRRWRVLRVNCQNEQDVEALTKAIALLKQPIALLRIARQIKILLRGTPVAALDINDIQFASRGEQGNDADLLL